MMSENLLSVFKKELGYVNATNQYVELSIRITEKEHSLDLRNSLRGLAQSVNLNVSTLTEDYNQRDKYLRRLLYDIGMPLIRNRNQECFSLGETDLSYLLVPIAVYDAFGGKGKCFMYESCQVHQHPCLDKNCFRSPWKQVEKERLCPFAAFWYHYSLSGKEIKYKSWLKNN